jgi:hypothetical protein
MKPTVFIHTNHKQRVGALVSAHSMRRNSRDPDSFDVRLIELKDHMELFGRYEGREYLRDGRSRRWLNDDLQSFTPLRFFPPELMDYKGRAVVVDPDVFAVQDVNELLSRDMEGKAICCCFRGAGPRKHPASSVMLLDCAKLTHWRVAEDFDALFRREREYKTWMNLGYEAPETLGVLEGQWNDFDKLSERTKMIHNTRRRTQPWKSGLPVDFIPSENNPYSPIAWANFLRRKLFGEYGLLGNYRDHPDVNQQNLFFGLLRECLENGTVTEAMLKDAMKENWVRHDAFEVMERTPELSKAA